MLSRFSRFFASAKPQVKLFTPGPLNTTNSVREKMLYDYGSRDPDFGNLVEDIKVRLQRMAEVSPKEYSTVLVQGSGTSAVEATIATAFPQPKSYDKPRQLLIASNGAYGERIATISKYANIPYKVVRYDDNKAVDPEDIRQALIESPDISHVAVVHSETTAGLLNPIQFIGQAIHSVNPEITYIVDAMSSFGAIPIDLKKSGIDYLVSSSNKNI